MKIKRITIICFLLETEKCQSSFLFRYRQVLLHLLNIILKIIIPSTPVTSCGYPAKIL
jgi:hypothetical protein